MRTGVTFALLIALCVLFTLHGSMALVNANPSPVINDSDTVIEIQLRPNGNATISVKTIVPIEDANDTAGFNEAAQAFEVGTVKGNSLDSFRRAASAASNASNRSMSIDNDSVDRTTARDGDVGMFILKFKWENFANKSTTPNGTYLTVDDAFTTPDGTWVPRLMENQTLKIRGPDGFHVQKTSIAHNGLSSVLSGPYPFDHEEFIIVYASGQPPASENASSDPVFPIDFSQNIIGVAVLILLVVLGSVGVFAFSRRDGLLRRVKADGGVGTDGRVSTTEERDAHLDPGVTATDADVGADTDSETLLDNGINVDLLSDEERVERLLEENGGRMKQANIVRETDWSNAKVSQLLSSMDEEERIEKLRIGRENLISLPNHGEDDQSRS